MLRNAILLLLILLGNITHAQDIPEPMNPPRLVNDFAGLLSNNEYQYLEKKLRNYHDTTSNQIYVVITDNLEGYDIADYSQRLGQKWKVGQKGKDNGIVMVIKPKTPNTNGKIFIATGYGLEEYVPDAITRQIVDNEIIPYFAKNQYAQGIDHGIDVIMGLISGRFTADRYSGNEESSDIGFTIIVILIFLGILLTGFKRNSNGRLTYHADVPFFIILSLLSNSGGGKKNGFGNFSSGSGGFSGGGGGSFGGGGAGGSW